MKNTLKNSFWQLTVIYTAIVVLIALGLLWEYSLQFHIFAIIIAVLGIFIIKKEDTSEETINKKIHKWLFITAIFFIFLIRAIPYIGNSIPLGYDVGIYKYAIESGLSEMPNWIITGPTMEPGFLYLMEFFKIFFSTQFILTGLLIFFSVILGLGVYFVVKEFSNKKTALIALFLYAFSLIQFKTFLFMYYKNVIGLSLMLFTLYFLKKSENKQRLIWVAVILGGLIGAIHRPTFYIFGLSYFFYAFTSPYQNRSYKTKKMWFNILIGIAILLVASLFYLGKWMESVLVLFDPVLQGFIQPGEGAGTFINFFIYQFSVLPYLPFALLGLFYFIRKRDFNILVIWAVLNLLIVYFQFFFFNRFIIFLDAALIIMASVGFGVIIKHKKRLGSILLIALIISAGVLAFKESINTNPLIDSEELSLIQSLNKTEANAFVMSTDSYYSPWVLGYSNRRTIAPGLFDYDTNNYEEWYKFWTTNETDYTNQFLYIYQKPLYLFIGKYQRMNMGKFNNSCLSLINQQNQSYIYKYTC